MRIVLTLIFVIFCMLALAPTIINMHLHLECIGAGNSFMLMKYHHKEQDKDLLKYMDGLRAKKCKKYYRFSYDFRHFIVFDEGWIQ